MSVVADEQNSQRAAKSVRVRVAPLPAWIDLARWLGDEFERSEDDAAAEASLTPTRAAELCAALRGLGVDGAKLSVSVTPALGRSLVRAARLAEARARRDTTPGFERPGVRVSGEGRYSLTPETLALRLGAELAGKRVIDACCGSGGNAIGFARAGCDVTAIELDAERLAEAEHNARVYGVAQRIRFVHGDALSRVPELAGDVLFIDPPWGVAYDKQRTVRGDFPLLDALLGLPSVRARFGALWLKLPASFATDSLPRPVQARAVFGEASGDYRRIKFILAELGAP